MGNAVVRRKYIVNHVQVRANSGQRKRRRIDRSMIGLPTNFVHTGHIGAGDVMSSVSTNNHLNTVEGQMRSKGGYDHSTPTSLHMNCIDIVQQS